MSEKNDLDEERSKHNQDEQARKPNQMLSVRKIVEEDEDEGKGGASGEIEFTYQDALGGQTRDDLLPAGEKKRLLSEHQATHEGRVVKQKATREQRALLKGKSTPGLRGQKGQNAYGSKIHPLTQTAQFGSGKDTQVNPVPTNFEAVTNQDKQKELRRTYDRQYQPEQAPRPTIKPQPGR